MFCAEFSLDIAKCTMAAGGAGGVPVEALARLRLDSPVAWDPKSTRVFAFSVCAYDGEDAPDWPLEGRKDTVFVDTLVARGVPRENIVLLLDGKAKHAAVTKALREHLDASNEDETLIFYFAGHGGRGASPGEVPGSLATMTIRLREVT